MGTTFRIVLYATNADSAKRASADAFARVADLDNVMSDYKKDSELMKLCRASEKTVGEPVRVSDDLFAVLTEAAKVSKASDGAFDVTVGPVVQLWRIARRTQRMPDAAEFASARSRVGYANIELDAAKKTVRLARAGMQLDLGGIGKGFAAAAALKVLKDKHQITRALVAASGDITCGDPPPGKEAWAVDIAPIAKGQKPRSLKLANASVSTSGDIEQFVEIGGVRYSHIVDPKTGLGMTGRRSVTVIAPNGATADSMTKAVMLMPDGKGMALVEEMGLAAYVVVVGEQEKLAITASKRFNQFVAE